MGVFFIFTIIFLYLIIEFSKEKCIFCIDDIFVHYRISEANHKVVFARVEFENNINGRLDCMIMLYSVD